MNSARPILAMASAIVPLLAGCGHTSRAQRAAPAASVVPPAQSAPVRTAPAQTTPVPDRSDAALADPKPQPAPAPTIEQRYEQAEQRSVDAVHCGALDTAERELRQLLPDAEAEHGFTALFMHHKLAWLRWAANDPTGSLDELGAAEAYMGRAHFLGNSSAHQRLNVVWFRAFFLLELARQAPASSRGGVLARAQAARKEHAARAGELGEQPQADLLAALFAVRFGNRALARKLSQSFHLIEDPDPTQLFVMIQVYSGIGAADEAASARQSVEQAQPGVLRSLVLGRTEGLTPECRSP